MAGITYNNSVTIGKFPRKRRNGFLITEEKVIVQDIRISESALLWNVLINFILASFLRAKRICQELQIVHRVGIHTLHRITLMQKLLKPLAIKPRRMSPYIQQIYIIIRFLLLLRMFIQCTILYTHTYRVHHLLGMDACCKKKPIN